MSERKARTSLQICATPFKSSFLSIPPSPFSPRTPLTPDLPGRQRAQKSDQQSPLAYPTPRDQAPSSPLHWVWKCHQCHHSYRLGVTRRCLEDGHHFCSGTTTIKSWRKQSNSRKSRSHRACPSEFDYSGWKTIGRWRRSGPRQKDGPNKVRGKQDCWNMCDYPSECRWGKRFGIHTPVEAVFPSLEVNSMSTLTASISTIPEGILKPEHCSNTNISREKVNTNLWAALLASAERRKTAHERGASPLKAEEHADIPCIPRDGDGDVVMETIDPALLDNSSSPPSSSQSNSSPTVDSLKTLVSRRRYRRAQSRSKTHSSADKSYAEPRHVMTEATTSRMDSQVHLDDSDMLIEGFAPLCRVRSRGSEYQSCPV